ncbi:hypothetical protein F0562_030900 [Nyssa sinensis]|uniref:F-box/LRR-repeat protein 15-like leucin rich repeat domain-containing protein n=1 Tax=Nyssa sinensis TaxID=561372 RepID=A0A5J5B281_9ASTE|nr:hypothetical protein F0562_030900 [Nyssa sinensis]
MIMGGIHNKKLLGSDGLRVASMQRSTMSLEISRKLRVDTDINTTGALQRNPDLTLGLPDECLAWVFGKLGCHDRKSCSLVCSRWWLVDSKSRHRLLLVARSEVSPLLPSLLSRFSSVSVLSLKCSRKLVSIDDDALSRIPTLLPCLQKLKLKGCTDVSDDGLRIFSLHRPPLLAKVSFASCGFGASGIISVLSNCPSLRDLTLKRLHKLDAQKTPLSLYECVDQRKNSNCHHQLERLCLKDLHNARLFIPLLCSASKSLKTLVVCRSSGNWDLVLESLQQEGITCTSPSSLSEIQMENVQMGDAGLVSIAACCPNLEVFYISRASDCTDDGLSAIANSCRKLRKLHIDVWSRFGSRTIGDEGMLSLAASCYQLQEVVLMGVPVTVVSLNALVSNCPVLERMALCNTDSVGDAELAFVAAKFSALKKLCIKNCPISNSGIEAIGEGCPNLVKLKVRRCRGITQASVSQMKLQRSGLVVSVDAGSLLFDREGMVVAEDEIGTSTTGAENSNVNVEGFPRRTSRTGDSAVPVPVHVTNNSTRTQVVCSSRTAILIGNALQLNRRQHNATSQSRSSSSARAAATSYARR